MIGNKTMPQTEDGLGCTSRRQLKSIQLQFLAIGAAVGSGLFVGSAQALRAAGPSLLIAYVVSAIAVYFVARCLGELTLAFPEENSFIDHVGRQLGSMAAMASGWGFWLSLVLIGMAELTAIGIISHALAPSLPQWIAVALAFVLLLLTNSAPVGAFGTTEIAMSTVKIIVILLFICLGFIALIAPAKLGISNVGVANFHLPGGFCPGGWKGLTEAVPVALFSFGGFEIVSIAAAETFDPVHAIPRAVNGLLLRFVLFYVGAISALLLLLPWNQMTPGTSPFAEILKRLHVQGAGLILNVVLIICLLSSCNSLLFAGARVLRTLALRSAAPRSLAHLNKKGIPALAVVITAGVISLAVIFNVVMSRSVFGLL